MSRLPLHRLGYFRYPDNLSEQEQRTYWRWVRAVFVIYATVIAVTVGASFVYRPAGDLVASGESTKHLAAAGFDIHLQQSVTAEKR